MKKRFMILAVAAVALMASCGDKKTAQNEASEDSISVADTTAATLDISAVAGSYEGTLPAADCHHYQCRQHISDAAGCHRP